jgi:hypothetical protein
MLHLFADKYKRIFQIHGRIMEEPPAFVQSDSTFMMVNVSGPLCWNKKSIKKEVSRPTLSPFLK